MDTNEIQKRIDAMSAAISAKGLKKPAATFEMRANTDFAIFLNWEAVSLTGITGGYGDSKYQFCRGDTVEEALDKAAEFIASLPSGDETKHRQFMDALGGLIDVGRENGIEVAYVNPLVETMKRLSENVLTFQQSPAE